MGPANHLAQKVCSRCWAWLYVYLGGYIYCQLEIRPSRSTVQRSQNNWISMPRLVTAWTITLCRESHFQFPRNRWQRYPGKDVCMDHNTLQGKSLPVPLKSMTKIPGQRWQLKKSTLKLSWKNSTQNYKRMKNLWSLAFFNMKLLGIVGNLGSLEKLME